MNPRFYRVISKERGWVKSIKTQTQTSWNAECGQSVVELAMVLPLLLLFVLGVIEIGYALYEQHLISKLAREGSNLISRNTTMGDAETVLQQAALAPITISVNDPNSRLILSVITFGTTGANNNIPIISNRRVLGTLSASSVLGDPDPTTYYNGAPFYNAKNPNGDTQIRAITPLPNGLTLLDGQSVFVTELYFRYQSITPFASFFAYALPSRLYASAYF